MRFLTAGLSTVASCLLASSAYAQSIDERIDNFVAPAANLITSVVFYSVNVGGTPLPLVVVWLVVAATFFTLYFGFINLRGMGHGFRLVRGDYEDANDPGEVTHFQALATAVSGTVGLGNIAGVAVAVSLGGPGATFWMILAGFLGMSSKFTECTLGVKFRQTKPDGEVAGGPMYYLKHGLAEKGGGFVGLGKVLAVIFAICCLGGSFGGGNMFQVNQAFGQLLAITGGETSPLAGYGWVFGLIIAILAGLVIIGGIRSIARVTAKLVPIMAIIYIIAAIIVLGVNLEKIPAAFGAIFSGAFAPDSIAGGIIGVLIVGFQRAAFSNEAGVGSAAIAHSAVKTKEPITEGLVALYEPFIDTVVICTMTALVIIVTGQLDPDQVNGVELTSSAFQTVISWFPYVLMLAVLLFAFSTMLAWSYYGERCWCYLFGETPTQATIYKVIFLVFVVIGASMNLGAVLGVSDAMIFAMSVPNVIGLYLLAPVVKRELQSYLERVRAGEIRPHHATHADRGDVSPIRD